MEGSSPVEATYDESANEAVAVLTMLKLELEPESVLLYVGDTTIDGRPPVDATSCEGLEEVSTTLASVLLVTVVLDSATLFDEVDAEEADEYAVGAGANVLVEVEAGFSELWTLELLAPTLLEEGTTYELGELLVLLADGEYAVGAYTLDDTNTLLVLLIVDVLGTNIDVVTGIELLELAGEEVSVYVIVYVAVGTYPALSMLVVRVVVATVFAVSGR
ncbi:hypothetical protein LTR08_003278 [Meristemomyces frigidus]|nr:hypothetical protein LTR08_003278 [Meristemomyces frigidus]